MNYIILISTPDSRGLVHKISSTLLDFNIEKNDEFVDKESGHFFMRTEISVESSENFAESQSHDSTQSVAFQSIIESKLRAILPPQSFIKITQKRKKMRKLWSLIQTNKISK